MKVLFAGTPDFARASLQALLDANIVPLAVLTQPDRRAGRGRKLTAGPVKSLALERQLPLMQPVTLRDPAVAATVAGIDADILIVAAYGLLLPAEILKAPRCGCVNVHASLLPRWRGAAPVQAAILAGDAQTGISLMQIGEGLDTGPVYASEALSIGAAENAGELLQRLALLGGSLLLRHLASIVDGSLGATAQDDARATYAAKIRKQDAALDWRQPATLLARAVRAYNPSPAAWFELDGEPVKCWLAEATAASGGPPGEVLKADRSGVEVACGQGALRMLSLQRPGRRPVSAAEFAAQVEMPGRRLG